MFVSDFFCDNLKNPSFPITLGLNKENCLLKLCHCHCCELSSLLVTAHVNGPASYLLLCICNALVRKWLIQPSILERRVGGYVGLSAGHPARFPGHPSADHLRWREKQERKKEDQWGEKGEMFPKQNTKSWGWKSAGEPLRSHAGSSTREKPNCPLWHKSHSVGTGSCLRDVPDPSALHCRVCFQCMCVHVWPSVDFMEKIDEGETWLSSLTVNESLIDTLN